MPYCIIGNVTTVPMERSAEARVSSMDIFIRFDEETTDKLSGWNLFDLKEYVQVYGNLE